MYYENGRILTVGLGLIAVVATALVVTVIGGSVEELAYAFAGGIGVAVVVIGSYAYGDRKGLPHSHSVAVAGIALGLLATAAILGRLLTEFGA
ncbi:hypothetical protein [Halovenus salina]|uniref:Major facilitator superfamily (MFS) profile domain-containing protein n=1 Tax=Halovenus salina TaxID=1510225 RepID=A0ABD5W145_9EURY|nr:hypothetical protein [Halovenus salina]